MSTTIQTIPFAHLAIAFLPVMLMIFILYLWSVDALQAIYGMCRMLIQLLLIGYVLAFIFNADNGLIILGVLLVMVIAAGWIALGSVAKQRWSLLGLTLTSIVIAGGLTLAVVTQLILSVERWYSPQHLIPLAGMIFAAAMNSISLAAERLMAELDRGLDYDEARGIALHAALIPIINSLFAVGLVSLPGMMTGQILSGVEPFIAARYQILVMCMLFTSAGFSCVLFLIMARSKLCTVQPRAMNHLSTGGDNA